MNYRASKKSLAWKLVDRVFWFDSRYAHSRYYRGILEEIPLNVDDRVIDIGCGSGWLSTEISRVVTRGMVVGLDISEYVIQRTRRITEQDRSSEYSNVAFVVADVEKMPFRADHFSYAVTFVSLSFWPDPIRGLEEVRRVLRPGGKVYVVDVYEDGPISARLGVKVFNALSPWKERLYLAKQYKGFIEEAGFVDVCQKKVKVTVLTEGRKGSAG